MGAQVQTMGSIVQALGGRGDLKILSSAMTDGKIWRYATCPVQPATISASQLRSFQDHDDVASALSLVKNAPILHRAVWQIRRARNFEE
jgi:hypothetical protein